MLKPLEAALGSIFRKAAQATAQTTTVDLIAAFMRRGGWIGPITLCRCRPTRSSWRRDCRACVLGAVQSAMARCVQADHLGLSSNSRRRSVSGWIGGIMEDSGCLLRPGLEKVLWSVRTALPWRAAEAGTAAGFGCQPLDQVPLLCLEAQPNASTVQGGKPTTQSRGLHARLHKHITTVRDSRYLCVLRTWSAGGTTLRIVHSAPRPETLNLARST